ncbi:uncharacterized protein LOC135830703 [Sycon ciliatum]|uniref:uncharacterized protein LOC135830703 n=1 Tax=Sycon ciliatum TaxID=27933 RepID=UPI0031F6B773
MEQESAQNVLDSVLFDVWEAAVLPLLSLADIFQLCGVTRHVQELLRNENTFRRLCQNRYQISPNLKLSYIKVARHLCIATRVSSIRESKPGASQRCIIDYHDHKCQVFNQKLRMIVQLSSLALMTPTSHTIIRYSPPLLEPLVKELWLSSKVTSSSLPNLSTSLIEEKCRAGEGARYRLADVTSLLLEICGSHELYQTCILKKLEQDIPEIESYLPYANRTCRLIKLAKCFKNVARRDPTLLSSLECENLVPALPQHITTRWICNLYDHLLIEKDRSHVLSHDVLATQNWIELTEQLAKYHLVLKLLIKRRLRVSQVEDYFLAVMEYNEIWHSLPQSSRPSRKVLYHDVGIYLLSRTPMWKREKELTKEELLNAMEQCGKKCVTVCSSSTHDVCCCARASCCVRL